MSTYEVPKLWPGSTIVCIASGPSLTQEDVNVVRGRARVIAVNTSYQMAPWADALFACDARWWKWNNGAKEFQGLKFALTKDSARWPGVQVLRKTGLEGLELKPHGLRAGGNSGFMAVNLAVHLGAKRIVLLGYDMQTGHHSKHHWHADHKDNSHSPYGSFVRYFRTLVEPLKALDIEVINCTRSTALKYWERRPIEDVFPDEAAPTTASDQIVTEATL